MLIGAGVALKFATPSAQTVGYITRAAVCVFFMTLPALLTFMVAYADIRKTKLVIEERNRLAQSVDNWRKASGEQ